MIRVKRKKKADEAPSCSNCGSKDLFITGPGSHRPAGKKKAIKVESVIQCRTCGHQEVKKK